MSARSFTLNKRRQGNITVERTHVVGEVNDHIQVILHNTAVVTQMPSGELHLSTGGWRTVTTKTAINRALMLLGVKASVSQRKGAWYVSINGESVEWSERTFTIRPTKLHEALGMAAC
jgi:hypothetical protein